jgi:lysozyme family protein
MRRITLAAIALLLAAAPVASIESAYVRSVANVLVSEGGARYTNHPADPGGPTKYGVTLRDVRAYIKANATAEDVRALTQPQAEAIYHDKYWLHRCIRGDLLPAGLDYALFDYGVNAGPNRAGLVLRRILAVNTDRCDVSDGLMLQVLAKDPVALIRAVSAERRRFYDRLVAQRSSMTVFKSGWMNRVTSVERIALKMAGSPPLGLFGEELETEPAFGPGKAWVQ